MGERQADALHAVVLRLLDASHHLPPDGLPAIVDAEVRAAGFAGAGIHVVDHELRVLSPFPPRPEGTLSIDGTIAGLAFRRDRPEEGEGDGEGVRRLWLPMRDGVERVGVLYLDAVRPGDEAFDDVTRDAAVRLATALSQLLISKVQYGDNLERARRLRPMTLAAELRWATLPPLYFATSTTSIACALEPSYDVAGDAFDYALNGSHLHFAVIDAMGHSLESARMANLVMAAYRHSRRAGDDLSAMYRAIGGALTSEFGAERFVTGQLAVLDTRSGAVSIVNAGHPEPWVLRSGNLVHPDLGMPSLPFGIGQGVRSVAEVALEPGDRLLLYTDGLVEAPSVHGERFGFDRLRDVISASFSEEYSAGEAARRLMHAVLGHLGGPPPDDATIVLVSWAGPEPEI